MSLQPFSPITQPAQQLLQTVIDVMPIGIQVLKPARDKHGRIIDFEYVMTNKAMKSYTEDDLTGSTLLTKYPGSIEAFERLIEIVESGKPMETIHLISVSGSARWVTAKYAQLGDTILLTYEEIADREQREDRFPGPFETTIGGNDQLQLIGRLTEMTSDAVYIADLETQHLIYVNEEATRLFGQDIARIYTEISPGLDPFIHRNSRAELPNVVSSIQDEVRVIERRLLTASGERKWFRLRHSILRFDTAGKIQQVLGTAQDISREKSLEKELANKNRELDMLTAERKTFDLITVNDFHDPLKRLYTSMEFIISTDARHLSIEGKANLRRAQASIQKMKLLTEDIVTYSSIQAPANEAAAIDLNQIFIFIKAAVEKKLEDARIEFRWDDLPTITGHYALIKQLFHQLVDNAIKFRKEDEPQHIMVKCEKGHLPSSGAHDTDHRMYSIISVADNGTGFDPAEAENIFKLFYRIDEKAKHKGSGIGLAICKRIMDIHGGHIRAESTPGSGSMIYCYFPLDND